MGNFASGIWSAALCVVLLPACDDEPAPPAEPAPTTTSAEAREGEPTAPDEPATAVAEEEDEAGDAPAEPPAPVVEPGDPVDDGQLGRATSRVNAHVRRLRTGEEASDAGGQMIAPGRFAFGLPAMSADGRQMVVVDEEGDEFNWDTYVHVLSVPSGGRLRTFHTDTGSLAEENEDRTEEEIEAAALPLRRVARELNEFLRAGEFRSMIPIPHLPDEPPLRGVPVMVWDGDPTHEIVIRDLGNSVARYSALPLDQPRDEPDPDSPAYLCFTDTPEVVKAWFAPDPDTVALLVVYENISADECPNEIYRATVRLFTVRAEESE